MLFVLEMVELELNGVDNSDSKAVGKGRTPGIHNIDNGEDSLGEACPNGEMTSGSYSPPSSDTEEEGPSDVVDNVRVDAKGNASEIHPN